MNRLDIAIFVALVSLAAPAAWAQGMSNPAALKGPAFGNSSRSAAEGKQEAPPPALPGARAEPAVVAPSAKVVTDMPPTEALFDAINRGDLPTARDSVNRGADLNGTNILGLTPIELAVDLGRNQISFYLLSLRGGTAGSSVSGQPTAAAATTRAERLAANRAATHAVAETRRAAGARPVAEPAAAVPQTARLFAGGGGAPIPQAGFLGFDPGR